MDAVTAAVTSYVATRWYRAPELLTGGLEYGSAVDLWAAGCIMGELIDQQPLFPGDNDIDQLYRIQLVLGPITDQQLRALSASPRYAHVKFPPLPPPEGLRNRYAGRFDRVALDFLQRLLTMEPQIRMTAAEALEHPYLRHFEQPAPNRLIEPPLAASRSPYCGNFVRQQKLAAPKAVRRRQVKTPLQLDVVVEGREVSVLQRLKGRKGQQQDLCSSPLPADSQRQPPLPQDHLYSPRAYQDDEYMDEEPREQQQQQQQQQQQRQAYRQQEASDFEGELPSEEDDLQPVSGCGSSSMRGQQSGGVLQASSLHAADSVPYAHGEQDLSAPAHAEAEALTSPVILLTAAGAAAGQQKPQELMHQQEADCMQQQRQPPQGSRKAAGVGAASRFAENGFRAQNATKQQPCNQKEAGGELEANKAKLTGARLPVGNMQLMGLSLKTVPDGKNPAVPGAACTPESSSGAGADYSSAVSAAAGSHSKARRANPPSAQAASPRPELERPSQEAEGKAAQWGAAGEQQLSDLARQSSIDLTLQQAARLIELDGISRKQRARQGKPPPQHNGSPLSQQQQQQKAQQQQQLVLQLPAAAPKQASCSDPAVYRWPSERLAGEAPAQPEEGPPLPPPKWPLKAVRQLSLKESSSPTSGGCQQQTLPVQTQSRLAKMRSNPHEKPRQKQDQAFFRGMQHQQQRQQHAAHRSHPRPPQPGEPGFWLSPNSRDWAGAPRDGQQRAREWQQLLLAAALPPVRSKGLASPASCSMSTALASRLGPPATQGLHLPLPCMHAAAWSEQQKQQRKPRAKDLYALPYAAGSGPLSRPAARPLFVREGCSSIDLGAPPFKGPPLQRPEPQVGAPQQGPTSWAAGSCRFALEDARGLAPLVVPPVSCATSYEKLIAFFRGLAEQQQPTGHAAAGGHHEGVKSFSPCVELAFSID
ncbi:hypothetical protein Efla_002910 [Eimeria flavescens]